MKNALLHSMIVRFCCGLILGIAVSACSDGGGSAGGDAGGGTAGTTPGSTTPTIPVVLNFPPDPASTGKLNDTGILATQCFTAGTDTLSLCSSASALALNKLQDGVHGRDAVAATNGQADGKLGFSFTKIGAQGEILPAAAVTWSCVKDNVTGLIWEGKTSDAGLHDKDNLYTHYDNTAIAQVFDSTSNTSSQPTQTQIDAVTNTVGLISAVNATGFCGAKDWRLPTPDELHSLVDFSIAFAGPTIDRAWFVGAQTGGHWTSAPYLLEPYRARTIGFGFGDVADTIRSEPTPVRLVRGKALSTASFVASADGQEVTDTATGLVWRQCPEGMVAAVGTCSGTSTNYTHEAALVRASAVAASTGKAWRLPNVKELYSIVDKSRDRPAINTTIFPSTPNSEFFSSTPYGADIRLVWKVNFQYGGSFVDSRASSFNKIRLVRDSN
jgi:Protein of unknown function (DUF1566)